MHTLHTRTAQIFKWWAEEGGEIAQGTSLWTHGWCPLLQGIARLCCDSRQHVSVIVLTILMYPNVMPYLSGKLQFTRQLLLQSSNK